MSFGPKVHSDPYSAFKLFSVQKRTASSQSRRGDESPAPVSTRVGRSESREPLTRAASKNSAMSTGSKRSMSREQVRDAVREKMNRTPDIEPVRGGNMNMNQVTPEYLQEFWSKLVRDNETARERRVSDPGKENGTDDKEAVARGRPKVPLHRPASSSRSPVPITAQVVDSTGLKPTTADVQPDGTPNTLSQNISHGEGGKQVASLPVNRPVLMARRILVGLKPSNLSNGGQSAARPRPLTACKQAKKSETIPAASHNHPSRSPSPPLVKHTMKPLMPNKRTAII